jgi:hypothetical protein
MVRCAAAAAAAAADALLQVIKAQDPNVLVLVDNCYGEFTEEQEPTAVGAGVTRPAPGQAGRQQHWPLACHHMLDQHGHHATKP